MARGKSGRSKRAQGEASGRALVKAGRRRSFHLLCIIGVHEPGGDEIWHSGYGFAHCRRCRREIVRSLLSDWQRPGSGMRVVWPGGSLGDAKPPRSIRPAAARPIEAETAEEAQVSAIPLHVAPNLPGEDEIPVAEPSSKPWSLLPDDFMGAPPAPGVATGIAAGSLLDGDFDFDALMRNDDEAQRARAAKQGR